MAAPVAMGRARWTLACALWAALAASPATAIPIRIQYRNESGQGFDDPALGAPRRAALEYAADVWARTLAGSAPIVIGAAMVPLGGTGSDALLAQTYVTTLHRGFTGAQPAIWYGAALANALSGVDLNGPNLSEIEVRFNADVDDATVLGSVGWYYGTDAQPGFDIDFVTVALHELGHGLNFFDTVDPATGGFVFDDPGIFDVHMVRLGIGPFAELRPTERLAAITSDALVWSGPSFLAAYGEPARLYAPKPFVPGASLSHWDTSFVPDQLMEPFYRGANHDPGLLLPALEDMGWRLLVPTPTPRAVSPSATPTSTPTPRATPRPPRRSHRFVYVSNFDAATVSVIDAATQSLADTVPVDDGPLGLAAAPDGRAVYVANFAAGTIAAIDTRTNTVADTIWTGGAPHSVAVAPDGSALYVTDTARDVLTIVDLDTRTVVADLPAGRQPAGVALSPDGTRAFVVSFGDDAVSVIDTTTWTLRATLPSNFFYFDGLARISIGPRGDVAFVSGFYSEFLFRLDPIALTLAGRVRPTLLRVDDVALHPDERTVYLAATDPDSGNGYVYAVDAASFTVRAAPLTGKGPNTLAVTPDGAFVYAVSANSNSVSVIRAENNRVVATIPVGEGPMGVTVVSVPVPDCAGDCDGDTVVTIDELVAAVRVALGNARLDTCAAANRNDDGRVTVDELVAATDSALHGCRGDTNDSPPPLTTTP